MANISYPNSDVSNTGGYTSTEASNFDAINDAVYSEVKYIQGVVGADGNEIIMGMQDLDILSGYQVTLSFVAIKV